MVCTIVFCVILFVYGVNSLYNGDNCTPSQGSGTGKCIPLKQCRSAILALQSGLYPDTCGFEHKTPLVCCITSAPIKETVSQQKCRQYSTFVPEFEVFAIVGGTNVEPKEFPHMAALGYLNGDEILFQCGGSLVSDHFVLTAGHCLVHSTYGPVARVRLGDHNLAITTDLTSPQDFIVSSRIPHPSYHSPSVYNDIALLRLNRPAQFTSFVKPACLYTPTAIPPTTELIATGWGLTEQGGNPSVSLQKVKLEMYTEQECNKTYQNLAGTRRLREGVKNEVMFCAGGRNSDKDTCQGDSGGPLQTYNKNERIYSIVGVTSFGKACGAAIPGVYTRVSYYVPWLESVIWAKN